MNVFQAIQYIIQAWEEIILTTIQNCWCHTNILSTDVNVLNNIQQSDTSVLEKLAEMLDTLCLPNQMGVNEFLTISNENIVYEVLEDD